MKTPKQAKNTAGIFAVLYCGGDRQRRTGQSLRSQKCRPYPSAGGKRTCQGVFEGEIPNQSYAVLRLAAGTVENGQNGHVKRASDEMGCAIPSERPQMHNDFHKKRFVPLQEGKTRAVRFRSSVRRYMNWALRLLHPKRLIGGEKWTSICCTGAVRTEFEKGGKKSEAWHDDISSRKLAAKELLRHARMERAAETTRRLPDVHYDEDCCRAENRTVQQNLNLLRKFAINLFKQHKAGTSSNRAASKMTPDCLPEPTRLSLIPENGFPCGAAAPKAKSFPKGFFL